MDYVVTDEELTSVADSIRAVTGDSEPLAWPNGFASALRTTANNILGNFATVVSSTTADRNYSATEYIVLGSYLYQVTDSVASGETFVEDVNIEKTSVGAEVSELKSRLRFSERSTLSDFDIGNTQYVSSLSGTVFTSPQLELCLVEFTFTCSNVPGSIWVVNQYTPNLPVPKVDSYGVVASANIAGHCRVQFGSTGIVADVRTGATYRGSIMFLYI